MVKKIPDPGSRIPDLGSRIRIWIKEFKYFQPQKLFLSSRKDDLGCLSRIQGLKRHRISDPRSGSATLEFSLINKDLQIFLYNVWKTCVPSSRPCMKCWIRIRIWIRIQWIRIHSSVIKFFLTTMWKTCVRSSRPCMTSYRKSTESWSSVVAMSLLSLIKATRYRHPTAFFTLPVLQYRMVPYTVFRIFVTWLL